jgi:oligopeptide/dipeptide ABC transporter ATP-binding protein
MALLEARNLTVGIRRKNGFLTAVDHIDFDIEAGEIAALAGESGCGKTLTALSIPRLLPPAAEIIDGEITFNAAPLSLLGEKALCQIRGRDIAMVFQEPRQSLNPLRRVGAQIAETLELHGAADKKAARAAALDMLEKLKFAAPETVFNAWPHQLSGGMCQRVMIAIAAICRPRLLVADEPTTALDAAVQDEILALLGRVNRDVGTAILFISHDLSVIRRFCRRLLVMYAGRIVEEGPAEALFAAPAHPYTRGLLGAIPRKELRGRPLANISGRVPSIEDRPPGCPFAPRCPDRLAPGCAEGRCQTAVPPQTNLGGGHKVRCFLAEAANA